MIKLGSARISDDWLAVGVDATSDIGESRGDPAGIGLPPDAPSRAGDARLEAEGGDGSFRVVIDASLILRYLKTNAKFAMQMAWAVRPNIHPDQDVEISFQDDNVIVHAHGTVDALDPFSREDAVYRRHGSPPIHW